MRDIRGLDAPFPVQVGGETAAFLDQQTAIGDSLPLALAILCTTTLVLLFLMTGSVVLPVKALIMNLLTLSAAFGLLVLIFQDGRLEGLLAFDSQGALEATQPVLLFCAAFGLSTDYGVFLLTRIKEARDAGLGERESVAVGLERTGRIVTYAALLFCIAIGAFATSQIVFIKEVGVGTALAVLIDAFLVRALLVPSLMALLGRWNWWAPRPLARLHARFGLRGHGVKLRRRHAARAPVGEGRWRGEINEDWWVIRGPFGGYVSALGARGAGGGRRPGAADAHAGACTSSTRRGGAGRGRRDGRARRGARPGR